MNPPLPPPLSTAPRLPRLSFGGGTLGREIDEAASREVLDYALKHGLSLLDTAEAYGGGNSRQYRRDVFKVDDIREVSGEMHSSENIIGRWLRDRKNRDQVQICTKLSTSGGGARVHQAVRESLARLQTDYVDIYMLHRPYPDVPIRETLEALTEEVQAGRVRQIGCSNFSIAQLREAILTAEAHGLARMRTISPPFNLANPSAREQIFPYCREQGISTLIYRPLAAGFLAGKYVQGGPIPKGARFDIVPGHIDVYFSDKNFRVMENLRQLSAELGEPMVKLAMAWVFQSPGVDSVLVGARGPGHIDNALAAFHFTLPPELKARMDGWLA